MPSGGRASTRSALLILCAVFFSACAAKRITLPTDAGAPFPDFQQVHAQVTSACRGFRTMTAELSLSGRAGDQRLRGRVVAGFERPASMRLEGVAPFGQPAFILVARDDTATLLLPRDARVVRGGAAGEILGALTGVSLAPAELQAILSGCVSAAGAPAAGRVHGNGWASIDLDDGSRMYLQRRGEQWQLRAARRGDWQIEYTPGTGAVPASVRLQSESPARVDVSAALSQVETNVDVPAVAFEVTIPSTAEPLTLDELRAAGPLRGQ